ncbi:MAG: hypothetical protein WD885_00840 [Candidatus Saccharimonadales bacterium]
MNILLVNNHTRHLRALSEALQGHNVELLNYKPGVKFDYHDKDLVILSGGGGEGLEIYDTYKKGKLWYDDQISFVRSCPKPILGICMGFEVIAKAYGADVERLPSLIEGFKRVKPTRAGKRLLSQSRLKQFESHEWCVPNIASDEFTVLAKSKTGVEIFRHNKRPIMAAQFHPEVKGGTLDLENLIQSTLSPA